MDSLTHIVLGACIGELIAGKQLGKKALFLGAFANSIPDLDAIASFWLPVADDLLAHRGFTHSFLFAALVSPLLAWVSLLLGNKPGIGFSRWLLFWIVGITAHDLLDAFNAYGTGWLEPFSHNRVAFHTLYVADPLFTIWLLVAVVALIIKPSIWPRRRRTATIAIAASCTYLALCIGVKQSINNTVEKEISRQAIPAKGYLTTPTLLNSMLWSVVITTDSGYYSGYRSIFDKTPNIDFHYDARQHWLLSGLEATHETKTILRFADGYYTVHRQHDTTAVNVLRFGEINGWADPQPHKAFYYYLNCPGGNNLIVQRGRVASRSKTALQAFINRIGGE